MKFIFLILFISVSAIAQAPPTAKKTAQNSAKIRPEGAAIYSAADFDSEVIETLPGNGIYEISKKKFGVFHRIRLKDGRIGYVIEVDVRSLNPESKGQSKKTEAGNESKLASSADKKPRSLEKSQVIGVQYALIRFREDTMGLRPTDQLDFYGLKVSGPNLAIEGEMYTDVNFLFHVGAPKYYEQATSQPASGWIFLADFAFQFINSSHFNSAVFWGFGPFFKYSRFETTLNNATTGGKNEYPLEDIGVGLKFNLGFVYRINTVSLRVEIPYYWEKLHHYGLGSSLQFQF